MKKVLVGVDLNTTYVWLVVRAADLAECIGAQVDLVYVASKKSAEERQRHQHTLDGLMEHMEAGLRGASLVCDGNASEVLSEMSRGYDVMVVGPREPAGWKRLIEKPMAVKVIAGARCPVFIPRTEEPKRAFPRILVGVDLNAEDNDERLTSAGEWARALGARLDVAYCEANPAHRLDEDSARKAADKRWQALRTEQLSTLRAQMERCIDAAARGEAILSDTMPATGLMNLSKDYDLLMVGTTDVASDSILMGSVAVEAVRHAHCDVMTLPSQEVQ
jgi:nucleotide-binding universal stress UspA family protein